MNHECIDTNIIVRYLIETEESIEPRFKGVFGFFSKLEEGVFRATLPEIVLFQSYFVLTSYYNVPNAEAASQLAKIIKFKGVEIQEKTVVLDCLELLQNEKADIVDAWLIAYSRAKKIKAIYSFDKGFNKHGLHLLDVE
jgi:predicted nucleic acid-binding protein